MQLTRFPDCLTAAPEGTPLRPGVLGDPSFSCGWCRGLCQDKEHRTELLLFLYKYKIIANLGGIHGGSCCGNTGDNSGYAGGGVTSRGTVSVLPQQKQ